MTKSIILKSSKKVPWEILSIKSGKKKKKRFEYFYTIMNQEADSTQN